MVQQKNEAQMVSVIIPAYNEQSTIQYVINQAFENTLVDEVILVDDGSKDGTYKKALETKAKVIRLPKNTGKAAALNHGIANASNENICFLDADIKNLNSETLDKIIQPVLHENYDMFVGICGRQQHKINEFYSKLPRLGGQRALTKETWKLVPEKYKKDFKIEIALNYYCKKHNKKIGNVVLEDLDHTPKEKKYGLVAGFLSRIKMSLDIVMITLELYIIDNLINKITND